MYQLIKIQLIHGSFALPYIYKEAIVPSDKISDAIAPYLY